MLANLATAAAAEADRLKEAPKNEGQKAEAAKVAEEVMDYDAEMDDADIDEHLVSLLGEEAIKSMVKEELEAKRASWKASHRKIAEKRRLVHATGSLKLKAAKAAA